MIPRSHPRYTSLKTREQLEKGVVMGITSFGGLIAHGRGEAFDYLISEKTHNFAKRAIDAAAAMLVLAKHPVISVNGNTAILATKELINLSNFLQAPLEVNIFHASKAREQKIYNYLRVKGAKQVLLPEKSCTIQYLDSNRKYINRNGIYKADVVFVLLEDGDRAEALIKNGKKVITIDLNPLSRTAKSATVTIIDNIVRTLPFLNKRVKAFMSKPHAFLETIIREYNNKKAVEEAVVWIKSLKFEKK